MTSCVVPQMLLCKKGLLEVTYWSDTEKANTAGTTEPGQTGDISLSLQCSDTKGWKMGISDKGDWCLALLSEMQTINMKAQFGAFKHLYEDKTTPHPSPPPPCKKKKKTENLNFHFRRV